MDKLGFNIPVLIAQLVNFTVLLVILRAFAYKPILGMLDRRSQRIRESLEAADQMKQQTARAEQDVKEQLDKARQEGQALIGQAQQIATRIQAEARQQAQQEAEALLARARSEIALERDGAIAELRKEFADLTISAAEKVIGQSLDRRAHQRLIQEVLTESRLGPDGDQ